MTENIVQIQFIPTFAQTGPEGTIIVDAGSQFAIEYSAAEIKDPFKKKGSGSYKFTILGTKENNLLLNNYFDINIQDGTYSVNKKQKVAVLRNGVVILDNAYMQLLNVNKDKLSDTYSDELVSYEVIVGDDVTSFFTEITNKYLTDVDFSDMDNDAQLVAYTAGSVLASQANSAIRSAGAGGYKFVLPHIQNSNVYQLEECKPAISAYEYWDRIHKAAGFQWVWTGYNSSDIKFDKLWIPYNGDEPKLTNQLDYNVVAELTTPFTQTGPGAATGFPVATANSFCILDTEILDPHNDYNPVTGEYIASLNTGTSAYDVYFEIDYDFELDNTSAGIAYLTTFFGATAISLADYIPRVGMYNQTTNVLNDINLGAPINLNGNSTLNPGVNTFISGFTVQTNVLPLTNVNIGDVFQNYTGVHVLSLNGLRWMDAAVGGTPVVVDTLLTINSIKMVLVPRATTVGYNAAVLMNQYVPQKIKQSDFIKSIANMYNLVMDIDPDNEKKIVYRTRDDFYDSGVSKDWTKKLATGKQEVISFISNSSAKKIVLSYKDDKDLPNTQYLEATNETYGQIEYEIGNNNVKGLDRKEVVFSPTPISQTSFGTFHPMIVGKSPKTNIRILLDGGIQTTGPVVNGVPQGLQTFDIIDYYTTAPDPANPSQLIYTPHGQFSRTSCAMLTHFDDCRNPTFDINYGLCDFYYFGQQGYTVTTNNLYNMFWRRTIGQIDSGKILTAYFNLNEFDINQLKLNDKIFIKDTLYNINKLQYDPNSNGPTKVELITVDDVLALPPFRIAPPIFQPTGTPDTTEVVNGVDAMRLEMLNNNYSDSTVMMIGSGNVATADVKRTIIIGENQRATQSDSIYAQNAIFQSITIGNTTITGSLPWTYDADFNIIAVVNPAVPSYNVITGINAIVNPVAGVYYNIIGGDSNNLSATSSIIYGGNNTMSGGYGNIMGGINNNMSGSAPSYNIVSGDTNVLTAVTTFDNNIYSGKNNIITGPGIFSENLFMGDTSVITGNTATDEMASNFVMGFGNTLDTTGGNNIYSVWTLGDTNVITPVPSYDAFALIVGGTTNAVQAEETIVFGRNHIITSTSISDLVGGSLIIGAANQVSAVSTNASNNIVGGNNQTLTDTNNSIVSGDFNILNSNDSSFVFGSSNTLVTGSLYMMVGGVGNTVTGASSLVIGDTCNLSLGNGSIGFGFQTNRTAILTGGYIGGAGTLETSFGKILHGGFTNDAIPTEIFTDGSSQVFEIDPDTSMRVHLRAIAAIATTGVSKEWEGFGIIKNVGGTTSLVAAITMTSTVGDAGLAAATIQITANNTNDSLKVEVTGIAATTIIWNVTTTFEVVKFV